MSIYTAVDRSWRGVGTDSKPTCVRWRVQVQMRVLMHTSNLRPSRVLENCTCEGYGICKCKFCRSSHAAVQMPRRVKIQTRNKSVWSYVWSVCHLRGYPPSFVLSTAVHVSQNFWDFAILWGLRAPFDKHAYLIIYTVLSLLEKYALKYTIYEK